MSTIAEIRGEYEDKPYQYRLSESRDYANVSAPVPETKVALEPVKLSREKYVEPRVEPIVEYRRAYCCGSWSTRTRYKLFLSYVWLVILVVIYCSVKIEQKRRDNSRCDPYRGWKKYTNVIYFNQTFDEALNVVYYEMLGDNFNSSLVVGQNNNERFSKLNDFRILYSWVKNVSSFGGLMFDTKDPYTKIESDRRHTTTCQNRGLPREFCYSEIHCNPPCGIYIAFLVAFLALLFPFCVFIFG